MGNTEKKTSLALSKGNKTHRPPTTINKYVTSGLFNSYKNRSVKTTTHRLMDVEGYFFLTRAVIS